MKMFLLIVLILWLAEAQSVSAPGSGLPEFSVVGYVDDQQIESYNSDTERCVPVASWMKEKESPEYWEMMTKINKGFETVSKYEMKIATNRFNHTRGFHFVQVMDSCELRDDGSTKVYENYRYDGEDYMYLDVQTGTFIPTMSEAQIITQRWNSPNVRRGDAIKQDLETRCIKNLKRFLEHGREDLERRVRPHVKVIGRESGEITKLHCLVYGFHPRAVDVKWMKNGIDDVPTDESTPVLPNPDGTYQIRVTAEVIPKDGDSYSCYVDHSSLEEPLHVRWEPPQHCPLSVIIGVVVLILVLASIAAGVLIYRRKKRSYMATGTSDSVQ
ncbi:class I histocompatibility antigen, F10 alpha chain-like isoform X2 [Dendropsophus ebraccatus]|uniref:class I histocompatibility antigen, F10 alpha chain-like isoform X2 n=1 Tax=Dendropsophus ebraccatus TaxID=150705 RepID=UPI003831D38C